MFFQPNFDLPTYTQKFLQYAERENYSPDTINGHEKDLKKFTSFIYQLYDGYIFTEEIGKEDIIEYLDFLKKQPYKANSIVRYLSSIRVFFKYLVVELDFENNPTYGIEVRIPQCLKYWMKRKSSCYYPLRKSIQFFIMYG